MDHLDQKTDEEVITLVLSDKHLYAEIVLRYEEKLRRYIRRIAKLTQEEIEDLLQDIFVKAYINIHGFNTSLAFSSWIYRITHNETMSLMRKKKVRKTTFALEDAEEFAATLASDDDVSSEQALTMDLDQMKEILDGLKEKYKEILLLSFLEEKSYTEISDILKIPPGTVATRLRRAKDLLKKKCIEADITLND